MARQYDLVVIGAGTAAMAVATRVRAAGRTVAVVDFRPFGGACALRGCDPKTMLIGGTSAIDHVRRMGSRAVAGEVHIAWSELMEFRRTFTDLVPELRERTYRDKGIDTLHGRAIFTGANPLDVGGETLEAKHIVLASGTEPVRLNIPGEEHLATNEDFLSLETPPPRIVLVGGGYIAADVVRLPDRGLRYRVHALSYAGGRSRRRAFCCDLDPETFRRAEHDEDADV